MNYHVGVGDKQDGPFSEDEIRQRIADGRLRAADLCWTSGWPEWKTARDVFPEAFPTVPTSPPPPPPMATAATRGPDGRSLYAPVIPARVSLTPPAVAMQPTTEPLAIASLVMGIPPFFIFCFIFSVVTIAGIVCGHIARSRIAKSNGQLTGAGMALAGLICGYAWLALGIIQIIVMVVVVVSSPNKFR